MQVSKRLSDQLSVHKAEIVATIIGPQWVEEVRPDRVVACTDSVAVLESIQSTTTVREDLLIELYCSFLRLHRGGIEVQFCWVPAHDGLKGNERVPVNSQKRHCKRKFNSTSSTWKRRRKRSD